MFPDRYSIFATTLTCLWKHSWRERRYACPNIRPGTLNFGINPPNCQLLVPPSPVAYRKFTKSISFPRSKRFALVSFVYLSYFLEFSASQTLNVWIFYETRNLKSSTFFLYQCFSDSPNESHASKWNFSARNVSRDPREPLPQGQ